MGRHMTRSGIDDHGDFARDPVPLSMAGASGFASTVDPDDFPHVPGYRVTGFLGAGGMSSVWRAVQDSTGRQVALKLMGGFSLGSRLPRIRFEREVELIARLNHPNVAQIYDSGVNHGVYFFAMELIEGEHLDDFVINQNLGRREILRLLQTVCQAADHAHQRGVIHRDLKPSNIIVTPDGEPHLVDFGLAKSTEPTADELTISQAGGVAGTIAFMAPEQAAGRTEQIGTASDVYSLGIIAFLLLTRAYPHDIEGSIFEIQRRIIDGQRRRLRQADPSIDADLEAVVTKATGDEPTERYTTAGGLADDLQRYLSGQPVMARPLTLRRVAWKAVQRHKPVVLVSAGVIALLLGLAVISHWQVAAARDAAETALVERSRALYVTRIRAAQAELRAGRAAAAMELLDSCLSAERGWEWHWLKRRADAAHAHLQPVLPFIDGGFDRDRGLLHAITRDGKLCTWQAADWTQPGVVHDLKIAADRIAISENGDRIVAVVGDQVHIFTPHGPKLLAAYPLPVKSLIGWRLSPRGHLLGLLTPAGDAHVLDVDSGALMRQVALGPDHESIAMSDEHLTWAQGDRIHLLAIDGGERQELRLPSTARLRIDFDCRGKVLLAATADDAWLIDPRQGRVLQQLDGGDSPISEICRTGASTALGHDNQSLSLVGASSRQRVSHIHGARSAIREMLALSEPGGFVSITPGGVSIWACQRLRVNSVFDVPDAQQLTYAEHVANEDAIYAATSTGRLLRGDCSQKPPRELATASTLPSEPLSGRDRRRYMWPQSVEAMSDAVPLAGPMAWHCVPPPDASTASAKIVANDGTVIAAFGQIGPVALTADRSALVITVGNTIEVWDGLSGRRVEVVESRLNPIQALAVNADATCLAVLGDNQVEVIRRADDRRLIVNQSSEILVTDIGLDAAGDRLFTVGHGLRIWHAHSGALLIHEPVDEAHPAIAIDPANRFDELIVTYPDHLRVLSPRPEGRALTNRR